MKKYKIPYAAYPFNMEELLLEWEYVEAETLEEAFEIVEKKYNGSIEIFKAVARKYYNEDKLIIGYDFLKEED